MAVLDRHINRCADVFCPRLHFSRRFAHCRIVTLANSTVHCVCTLIYIPANPAQATCHIVDRLSRFRVVNRLQVACVKIGVRNPTDNVAGQKVLTISSALDATSIISDQGKQK